MKKVMLLWIFALFLLAVPSVFGAKANGLSIIENYSSYEDFDRGVNMSGYFTLIPYLCSDKAQGCSMQGFTTLANEGEEDGSLSDWTVDSGVECIVINGATYLFGNSSIRVTGNCEGGGSPPNPRKTFTQNTKAIFSYWTRFDTEGATTTGIGFSANSANQVPSETRLISWQNNPALWSHIDATGNSAGNQTLVLNQWYEILQIPLGTTYDTYAWNGTTFKTFQRARSLGVGAAGLLLMGFTSTSAGAFGDNMKVFDTSSKNNSAKIIPYTILNLSSAVNQLYLKQYSNETGVEFWASMNNGTTWTNLTNNSNTAVSPTSSNVIIWINQTNPTANNYFMNVTGSTLSDTTPPIINGTLNATTGFVGSVINSSFNLTDETGLLFGNITVNLSTGKVFMNYSLSGTSATISNSTTFTAIGVFNITGYATDTANNVKQNSTIVTITDGVAPTANTTLNLSTFKIFNVVNFSCNATDDTSLLSVNLTVNLTTGKRFDNYTASGTSYQISNTTTIAVGRGNVFNFTCYATDTNNNVKQNDTKITIADTLGAILIGINNTSPKINQVINISGNCTDADGDFSLGTIAYNISGNPQFNLSFTPLSAVYFLFNFSQAVTINLTRANVINFTTFCNDTAGTTYQKSSLVTVQNTLPTTPSIINASDKTFSKNQTINWTSTDADLDTILYTVYFSGTPISTNDLNFTTNMIFDGVYFLNVSAADQAGNSSNSSAWNITLDTTTPIFSTGLPANGTAYNRDINLTVTCTDTNLFELNVTVNNISTSGVQSQIWSNTTINLTPTYTSYSSNVSINISTGEGSKNASVWCGDTKNKEREFKTAKHAVSNDQLTIQFNDTASNVQLNITFTFEDKNGQIKSYDKDTDSITTTVTDIGGKTTGINVDWFDFMILYNIQKKDDILRATFNSNSKSMQTFDNLPNHLLFGSGKEKVSIDAEDLIKNNFTVNTEIKNNKFTWAIGQSKKNDGEKVEADPRIDNLNIQEQSSILIVDTIAPSITQTSPPNNSYSTTNIIIFNFTTTDTGNSGTRAGLAYLFTNFSGSWKQNQSEMNYNSTVKQGFNITTAILDGNYLVGILVNDTAGNQVNSSNITIQIDGTNPVIQFNETQFNNNSKLRVNNFKINITNNETFFKNITFSLFNSSSKSLILNSTFVVPTYSATFSNLADGYYWYNVTSFDQGNLSSSTDTRNLSVDVNGVSITLTSPTNNSALGSTTTSFSYSSSHFSGVNNCVMYFDNVNVSNTTNPSSSVTIIKEIGQGVTVNWLVNCSDNLGVVSTSGVFTNTLNLPPIPNSGTGGGASGSTSLLTEQALKQQISINTCNIFNSVSKIVMKENENTAIVTLQNPEQKEIKVSTTISDLLSSYIKITPTEIIMPYSSVANLTIERKNGVRGNADGEIAIIGDVCENKNIIQVSIESKQGVSKFGNNYLKLLSLSSMGENLESLKTYMKSDIGVYEIPFSNQNIGINTGIVTGTTLILSLLIIPFLGISIGYSTLFFISIQIFMQIVILVLKSLS